MITKFDCYQFYTAEKYTSYINKTIPLDYVLASAVHILKLERYRDLRKDDTQIREAFHIF